ncbi:MAG: HAD family phosphatase [Clostridia bacterium]|nr:HAD family phosphatase [Clostridia bacterium]
MIKLHLFDIDGTVLDSMRMWDDLAPSYLKSLGIDPPDDISEIIDPMPVDEVYAYLAETFSIPGGEPAVRKAAEAYLHCQYDNVVLPFDDAVRELEELQAEGTRIMGFSNTPLKFFLPALERHGIDRYFEKIYTVEDTKIRKSSPESFLVVCDYVGLEPTEVMVHDDSSFALEAAKAAGCLCRSYDRYR